MTTPATQMGIVAGQSVLAVKPESVYFDQFKGRHFQMRRDDGSNNPIIYSLDSETPHCFNLDNLEIIELPPVASAVPTAPVQTEELPVPVGPTVNYPDTPAGKAGILVNSTIVYYNGPDADEGHYTMIEDDNSGIPRFQRIPQEGSKREWLKLAHMTVIDPATLPEREDKDMTDSQRNAFNTFKGMYTEAVKYREGKRSAINSGAGICDNIDEFADRAGARQGHMHHVKENLIRRTPSYSGSYHYPVPGVDGKDASDSFSDRGMWDGQYGANRLQVLAEMIELIKTQWESDLTGDISSARRVGLKVGDYVLYTRNGENSVWVFRHDDRSGNPSFHRLGKPDSYNDIELCWVKKIAKPEFGEMTVGEFIAKMEEKDAEKLAIETQIKELQAKLTTVTMETAVLDASLAQQHKVARIKN